MRSHPSILQFYVCICLALAGFARAQQSNPTQAPVKPPARLISPEVHGDGAVTFRFRAPHAQAVKLAREGAQPVAMEKDEQGVWSVNLDRFSWVGAFSSGGIPEDFPADFPSLALEAKDVKATQQLHLLWIACGTDDHLITLNRSLRAWLKSRDVQHTAIETPGGHAWMLWRRNLADFASLLFR